MEYIEYIDLGFRRIELDDMVVFKQTGYGGYVLEKDYDDKIKVCVLSCELDKPKLYINNGEGDIYHIIPISKKTVFHLFSINK